MGNLHCQPTASKSRSALVDKHVAVRLVMLRTDLFVERVRTVREMHDEKSIELPRMVESSRFSVPSSLTTAAKGVFHSFASVLETVGVASRIDHEHPDQRARLSCCSVVPSSLLERDDDQPIPLSHLL